MHTSRSAKTQIPVVAIVDPYSSGRLLAREFFERGYKCVRVQSSPRVPDVYVPSLMVEDYEQAFICDDNLEEIVTQLRALDVKIIIPGCDTGVELADAISAKLGLLSNGTQLSAARRDKFAMAEALRAQGVRCIPHIRAKNLNEIDLWIEANRFAKVVLKPINSAGTDSVFICSNAKQVQQAFDKIFGRINRLDLMNDYVLVQPLIIGTEYFVNSVSYEGKHFVSDIWRYKKIEVNGASFVYDALEFMDPQDSESVKLTAYIQQVLPALGINYGPAHSEVLIDDQGPVLVETGARVCGGDCSVIVKKVAGASQADLTAEAYTNPRHFFAVTQKPYRRLKKCLVVYFISTQEGVFKGQPRFDEIINLESYSGSRVFKQVGDRVTKTVDFCTELGLVELVHADDAVLQRDYARVRELETQGLFIIE